jgi:Leucine-rich repeat (LRR) protein
MDTVSGDRFIEDCARYIRFNEAKLGQASASGSLSASSWANPTAWLRATSPPINHTAAAPRAQTARPAPLRLTSHHLYYLLIRFEALQIATGPLDVRITATSRPSSTFTFISGYRKDKDDTMSISSLQTTMSVFGLGGAASRSTGWWSGMKPDINAETKYVYSAMTKIPAIRIGPPPLKLVEGFEDCPGELSVPLDIFKNVQILEFEDTDPRSFIGWDRLSTQLRSLGMKRSGVEDITDIIVDAVILDGKRRRGEKVRARRRKVHAPNSSDEEEQQLSQAAHSDTVDSGNRTVLDAPPPPLPSLSWHFLRHLSLSDNSLTFLPSSCLFCLSSLTSLDLSSNLLIAVPPSLHLLPVLHSLNLTNNLIDSVMGIPDALPTIKALNLSQNRLESLCGLERLPTLMRIDLRRNEIFEAGEVGRLATLPKVFEVFVAGNPLIEEVDDARVDIFVEFAKEGNNLEALKLDGEGVGYFERQRIRERVPKFERLANKVRDDTPSASEVLTSSKGVGPSHEPAHPSSSTSPAAAAAAGSASAEGHSAEPVIKTVRHRSTQVVKPSAQRRNRRIVELPQDLSFDSEPPADGHHAQQQTEVSDSDYIKRAALAGDNDVAIGTIPRQSQPLREATLSATTTKEAGRASSPFSASTRKPGAALATSRTGNGNADGPVEESVPGPRIQVGRQSKESSGTGHSTRSITNSASTSQQQRQAHLSQPEHDLRKKIEALKGEVGDDWLRLLARGESVYIPLEHGDGDEGEEE